MNYFEISKSMLKSLKEADLDQFEEDLVEEIFSRDYGTIKKKNKSTASIWERK